jgi:hypothetical protein
MSRSSRPLKRKKPPAGECAEAEETSRINDDEFTASGLRAAPGCISPRSGSFSKQYNGLLLRGTCFYFNRRTEKSSSSTGDRRKTLLTLTVDVRSAYWSRLVHKR